MRYYLYKWDENDWICQNLFSSYDELIFFLALHQEGRLDQKEKRKNYHNAYLNQINLTGNDLSRKTDSNGDEIWYLRPYLFLDESFAIVDVREFYSDIIQKAQKFIDMTLYPFQIPKLWKKYFAKPSPEPVFRLEAVPHTGKSAYWKVILRHKKIGHLIKELNDSDYNRLGKIRKYKDLKDPWDDYGYRQRKCSKCWKDQTKCRHQWEIHL